MRCIDMNINFPQFLKLGLSFSEVNRSKKQIQEMLNNPEVAEQWKQKVTTPEHERQRDRQKQK